MVMSKIFFHDNVFQEYMTLKDCPYCHDSVNFTEIAKNPRIVRCNICGLYRLYPRMNRQGQIAMLKYNEEKIEITKWKNKLVNKKIFYPLYHRNGWQIYYLAICPCSQPGYRLGGDRILAYASKI